MLQRVMPELMGLKNILAINDEAHHCYREKPGGEGEEPLKGDEKKEAEKNKEAPESGFPAWKRSIASSASRACLTFQPRRFSSVAPAILKAPCFPGP